MLSLLEVVVSRLPHRRNRSSVTADDVTGALLVNEFSARSIVVDV